MPTHRRLALLVFVIAMLPAAARAGTLCGTVIDRSSSAPVAHAGIFLRLPTGTYTGLNGATDDSGHFCIDPVPAGTYDLEVRVDDEQVGYVRGVVVTATTTDVSIGASEPALRFASPVPNPARSGTQFEWTLSSPASVHLFVFDARGRLVRGWFSAALAAGHHTFTWNLRDASNRQSEPGLYFVRLEALGESLVRTLVLTP